MKVHLHMLLQRERESEMMYDVISDRKCIPYPEYQTGCTKQGER